jgi:hypothetical protein
MRGMWVSRLALPAPRSAGRLTILRGACEAGMGMMRGDCDLYAASLR